MGKDKVAEIVGSWSPLLRADFMKPYMADLHKAIEERRKNLMEEFYPKGDLFEIFKRTPMDKVKVLYVIDDCEFNPCHLEDIETELRRGFDVNLTLHKDYWWLHEQGIMFLPRYLSKGIGGHHKEWRVFTDQVILSICGELADVNKPILVVSNNAGVTGMLNALCPGTEIIGKLNSWNYIDNWIKLNYKETLEWSPPIESQTS